MSLIKSFVALSLCLASSAAMSNEIALSKNVVSFENNLHRKITIDVLNISKTTPAYVQTRVREVKDPEKGTKSNLVEFTTPKEAGLFVTPNKQVVKPGKERGLLSIINVNGTLDKERVYRVDVTPIIAGIEKSNKPGQRIKVLLAYDILVYVQPNNPRFTFDHVYTDGILHVKNTGNSHFKMIDGLACNDQDVCTGLAEGNLFAGITTRLRMTKDVSYVTYKLIMKGQLSKRVRFERK